jgi:lysyl-tRNA synthetase class 2
VATWDLAGKALKAAAVGGPDLAAMKARALTLRALRSTLDAAGFLEVETPILQPIHGGANARPFLTHANVGDTDLYLRIAPELALKKLLVVGMERIYELGKDFRNEGVDATHNPEFTALEVYEAFSDYERMRHLARDLIIAVATAIHGEPVAIRPGGERVALDGPWPVVTVHEAVGRAIGLEVTTRTPVCALAQACAAHGVAVAEGMTALHIVADLYEKVVEPATTVPTFYTDFPVETSPLTRPHRRDPLLAERWDLVAWGAELGTAYTELADPVDQRERLTRQSLAAAAGDPEAMELDESFLTALECAMPPAGGLGLGVDRLIMALTGRTIRQTLAFPFLRG